MYNWYKREKSTLLSTDYVDKEQMKSCCFFTGVGGGGDVILLMYKRPLSAQDT